VGSGVPRFYLPLDQVFPQSNVSQFIVMPKDLTTRESLRIALPALMASEFPEVRARIKLLPNGPPVPFPVQFRVAGPDPLVLRQRADEVKALMRENSNTRGVNDNWNEAVKVLRFEVDQDKARALGVSSQSIAQSLRVLLSGNTVGQYREGDKLVDIVLRQPVNERQTMSDLSNAYVPTNSGKAIPLLQIAKPVFDWEPGVMWRENREYAITAQSDITEGLQGATVTKQLLPALNALQAKWAQNGFPAYTISVAGAVEESSKGSASIAAGIPLMLFVTFTLLMIQLQSFSRAMLVFLTGPMGIAGVDLSLLVLDRPFVDKPNSRQLPLSGSLALRWNDGSGKFWAEARVLGATKEDRITAEDQAADDQRIPTGGTPGYLVASLRAGWQVTSNLDLTCSLENVSDEDYRIHGSGQNESGLGGVVSVKMRW
jgi:multidrug efflux pump subunit AcrB